MALSDFLFNTGNKIKMGLSRFAPTQNYVSPSGDYDPRQFNNYPTWYQGEKVQPRLTMSEMLLGQKAQTPAQEGQAVTDENGNTTLKMGTSEAPRTGGILPDIMSGFDENRNNAFSLNNLEQGTLEGGRQKGFAYKLGEGLGSIARIANTPLGRGLIVGGLVTATGGNPLQALTYGGSASMLNQQNVLRDRAYRNDIVNSETQRIMNDTSLTDDQKESAIEQLQNQVSAYRGYITPEVYSNLIRSQQLRDNAAYRKMYFDAQQENQKIANRFREMQYAGQQRQNAIENQFKRESLDIQKEKAQNQGKKAGNIGNLNAVSEQLKRFEGTFKNMPGKLESNTLGRIRNATGFQTKEEANFNSQRTLLFNKIARDLGGEKGVLSDQDIKRIEKSLPDYTDSYEQKQAKMAAIYDLLNDRLQVEGATTAQSQETDPLGIL